MENNIERYAFIDVQNTESTVNQLLDFSIDWNKMFNHLKIHWNCNKVFFYSGIQKGDINTIKQYEDLSKIGYEMKVKTYSIYRNRDTLIKINCNKCNYEINHKVNNGTRWKSNCDVEFSVDVKNNMKIGSELLFFTGDGDFEYLIKDVVEKGIRVYIISSAKKTYIDTNYFISRFSTKLRNLINDNRSMVNFIDIESWKNIIKR